MKRIAVILLLAGCTYPGKATREERLATASDERTRSCRGDGETAVERVLHEVHAVRPLYVKLRSGPRNIYTEKLVGARLDVPARPGMTAEDLERVLRCHQARSLLGDVSPAESDPFWLANGWIDIHVQSDWDGLTVMLRGQTPEESKLIESKAEALVARTSESTSAETWGR
jgi:hypothetical protein